MENAESRYNSKHNRHEIIKDLLDTSQNSFILEDDVSVIEKENCYDVPQDGRIDELEVFLKYGALLSSQRFFLIIHKIDLYDIDCQVEFFYMAKNRCIKEIGDMPDDYNIVFTVSSPSNISKIEYNLWNFGADLINISE